MYGAILGDIIGAPYEWHNTKRKDFPLFSSHPEYTDDTVMTIAVAAGFLSYSKYTSWGLDPIEKTDRVLLSASIVDHMKYFGRNYPDAGYGGHFRGWLKYGTEPYNSWGNGSAMRVSSVAWLFDDMDTVREMARLQAAVTHNHPEGVKGAEAVAAAVFLARKNSDKDAIKKYIVEEFDYDLNRTCDEIRPDYQFDVSCQGSVPEAVIAFLEGSSFEDVIRNAVSLGGDSDTIGAMAGAIAEAYYGVPEELLSKVRLLLPDDMLAIINEYDEYIYMKKYGHPKNGIGFGSEENPYTPVMFKDGVVTSTFDEFMKDLPEITDEEMERLQAKRKEDLAKTIFKIDVYAYTDYTCHYSIEVKDLPSANLILSNSNMLPYERTETISQKQIREIKNLIKQSNVFDIGEIEDALVLDGYDDDIYFSVDGMTTEIKTDNLGYHWKSNKAPNACKLLSVIDQIYSLLKDYGIDRRFNYL